MSLRTRIALATAISVAAITLFLGAIGYLGTRSRLFTEIRQELKTQATPYLVPHPAPGENDSENAGPAHGHRGGQGPVCAHPDGFNLRPSGFGGPVGYFQSVCPDGRVVGEAGGSPKLPVTARVRAIARAARGSDYFSAVVDHTRVEILAIGDRPDRKAIEVALPLTETDHTLDGLIITYLILVAVGIVLAGIVGFTIGRVAVAPILRFAARTEQATSSLTRPGRLELGPTSELRRLAASFNRTLDALEASVEAQRHLIADASHELRTPMAALRSNIQIFLDAEQLPVEDRLELQASIMAELDELTQLVADVLELARGARAGARREPVELDVVVGEAVERARRRAPEMRFELDLEPTVVDGSPELIARAVSNLIDNARKWSDPDGLVEVTLSGGTLTVRDHGPGIAEEDLPHVFDRFYRSDRARRMPGSGLGLAIVKQAAEAHGGEATAANGPGGGALMRVSFAVAARPAPPEPAARA
jgi:two-component system sensor histidine kinase MprB